MHPQVLTGPSLGPDHDLCDRTRLALGPGENPGSAAGQLLPPVASRTPGGEAPQVMKLPQGGSQLLVL